MRNTEPVSDRHAQQVRKLIALARQPGATDTELAGILRAAAADDGILMQALSALTVLGEAVESHQMALAAAHDTGYRIGLAEGRDADGVSPLHPALSVASLSA